MQTIRRQRTGGAGQFGNVERITGFEGGECQQRCVLPVVFAQRRIVTRGVEEGRLERLQQGAIKAGRPQEAFPSRACFGFGALPVKEWQQVLRRPIPVHAEQRDDMSRQQDAAMTDSSSQWI